MRHRLCALVLSLVSAACTEPADDADPASAASASPPSTPTSPATVEQESPDLGDIWLVDPSTGSRDQIVVTPGTQTDGELAPDGTRLAYEGTSGDTTQIFVTEWNGKTRQLTRGSWDAVDPTWSPDGAQIAFATSVEGGDTDIFVMDADGGHVRRVFSTQDDDAHPDWSPTGDRIVFHERYVSALPGGVIWMGDLRTGSLSPLTRIAHNPWGAVEPAWSPDGRWIAFNRFARSTLNGRIVRAALWRMRTDGSNERRFLVGTPFDTTLASPAWSPDGGRIVVERDRTVSMVDAVTGRARSFIGPSVAAPLPDGSSTPSWSPWGIVVTLRAPSSDVDVSPQPGFVDGTVTFDGSTCELEVAGPIDQGTLSLRFINRAPVHDVSFEVVRLRADQRPEDLDSYTARSGRVGTQGVPPQAVRTWSNRWRPPNVRRAAVVCFEDMIPSQNGFAMRMRGVVGPIEVT